MKRRYVNRKCYTHGRWKKQPITITFVEQYSKPVTEFMKLWVGHISDMPPVVLTFQDHVDGAIHDLKYAILLESSAKRCYQEERAQVPVGTFQRYKVGESELWDVKERHKDIRKALQLQRKLREIKAKTPQAAA